MQVHVLNRVLRPANAAAATMIGLLGLSVIWVPTLNGQVGDTLTLEPIVVTATRVPTPRSSVAATVTVLDGERLRSQGIHQVLDALRLVPGLSVVQSGSFGSQTSVLVRGGESDYLKVLIDGVAVNDPGGAFDFANLTLENVDKIEVVRGPVSVLYGSDAVAGVVEIFTRSGAGRPALDFGVRAGTFESVLVDGAARGGTDRIDASVGVSRFTTSGVHAFNNRFDQLTFSGSIRARPDARTEASVAVRYGDSDFHFPTDGAGRVVDRNARQDGERLVSSFNLRRHIVDWLEATVSLGLSRTDGGVDDAPDNAADTLGFFGFQSSQVIERRSAHIRANLLALPSTVVTAGASIEEQRERSTNESLSQFGRSEGSVHVDRGNAAYYLQLQAQPLNALAVNGGLRLDDNEAFGTFVTYRVGATYRFPSFTRVRASAGKAFKEPTFFENFSQTPFALGNPDLEPERSSSWEIGLEQALWGGRARIGVAYFDQRFEDLIQYTAIAPESGWNYFNVAAADASGVEVEAAVGAAAATVTAHYTYVETRVRDAGYETDAGAAFVDGARLLRRPTHTLGLSASYRLAARASVGLDLLRVGSRDDRDFSSFPATPVVLPGYTRVDASAGYTVLAHRGRAPGLELRVRVENVFDTSYEDVFGFPARQRVLSAGGRLRY